MVRIHLAVEQPTARSLAYHLHRAVVLVVCHEGNTAKGFARTHSILELAHYLQVLSGGSISAWKR